MLIVFVMVAWIIVGTMIVVGLCRAAASSDLG